MHMSALLLGLPFACDRGGCPPIVSCPRHPMAKTTFEVLDEDGDRSTKAKAMAKTNAQSQSTPCGNPATMASYKQGITYAVTTVAQAAPSVAP